MHLRLVDKDGFKSPLLYIHPENTDLLKAIENWFIWYKEWLKRNPMMDGLPIGRRDPEVALVDLMRELTQVYLINTPNNQGRILGTIRIINQDKVFDEHVTDLNLFDKEWKLV